MNRLTRLTPRQTQMLLLVANGMTDAEIAEHLWVTPETVGTVLRHAFRNLGVRNRAHAVAVAICLNEIDYRQIAVPAATPQKKAS